MALVGAPEKSGQARRWQRIFTQVGKRVNYPRRQYRVGIIYGGNEIIHRQRQYKTLHQQAQIKFLRFALEPSAKVSGRC